MNTYLTIHDYIREVTGQEKASLIGNLFKVSTGGVIAGATSLPATPVTTVNLAVNDPITIFDGSSSEVVTVTATTSAGASTIPVTAFAFSHAAGTSCASDGPQGSLAEAVIEGSAEVERICRQSLLQATYTTEDLPLKTSRAMIDNGGQLLFRPRQSPVQSISAITIQYAPNNTVLSVDVTGVVLLAGGKLVKVPIVKATGTSGNYQLFNTISQLSTGDVLVTYVAGYAYANLPYEVKRAATLLVSDILADRANANGVADYSMGVFKQTAYLRGDLSGESALVKRARKKLRPYVMEGM